MYVLPPLQDPNRLYYHPAELKMFDNIECEWPLFFSFLVIEGIFTNNLLQVRQSAGLDVQHLPWHSPPHCGTACTAGVLHLQCAGTGWAEGGASLCTYVTTSCDSVLLCCGGGVLLEAGGWAGKRLDKGLHVHGGHTYVAGLYCNTYLIVLVAE